MILYVCSTAVTIQLAKTVRSAPKASTEMPFAGHPMTASHVPVL